MIDDALIEILSCPFHPDAGLKADQLRLEDNRIISGMLACNECGRIFAISDGIADLLPDDDIRSEVGDDEFARWRKALGTFMEWRKATWTDPALRQPARKRTDELKQSFFEFARISPGMLLDVGGAGGFIRKFLPDGVAYHCIDPLPVPEDVKHFPFVRGVGEFLPFRSGVFDTVTILESLDHLISPARFIAEASRVLRRGGILYISQDIGEPVRGERTTRRKIINLLKYTFTGRFDEIARKAGMEMASHRGINPEESHTHIFSKESLDALVREHFETINSGNFQSSYFLALGNID